VALTSALGSSLVNALYVLDEPSIGLHPRDNHRLVRILKGLRDLANTVVVVEHDPEIIRESDFILDLGPQAGEDGGRLMYFGPTAGVNGCLTGQYLRGVRRIPVPERRRAPNGNWLTIRGAAENNLKNIDVSIPLGLLVCLTGVSGSGKSTLAEEILYKAATRVLGNPEGRPGQHRALEGLEHIDQVVLVDQRAVGRTPRANPLTYTKAFDPHPPAAGGHRGRPPAQLRPGPFFLQRRRRALRDLPRRGVREGGDAVSVGRLSPPARIATAGASGRRCWRWPTAARPSPGFSI